MGGSWWGGGRAGRPVNYAAAEGLRPRPGGFGRGTKVETEAGEGTRWAAGARAAGAGVRGEWRSGCPADPTGGSARPRGPDCGPAAPALLCSSARLSGSSHVNSAMRQTPVVMPLPRTGCAVPCHHAHCLSWPGEGWLYFPRDSWHRRSVAGFATPTCRHSSRDRAAPGFKSRGESGSPHSCRAGARRPREHLGDFRVGLLAACGCGMFQGLSIWSGVLESSEGQLRATAQKPPACPRKIDHH